MKCNYKGLLSLFLSLLITSCNSPSNINSLNGSTEPIDLAKKAGNIVSVTKLSTRSKQQLNSSLERLTFWLSMRGSEQVSSQLEQLTSQMVINYSVDTYKVIYKTKNTDGNLINVSGLLAVPRKETAHQSPMMSIQHGMILSDTQAPSFHVQTYSEAVIAASLGYIVIEADYIGYGESTDQVHPYVEKETLSGAAIDLLRASKIWLKEQSITDNGQLFIAGYSEGGYATLAMQKRIQEELSDEFTVTASVPAQSAYDLVRSAAFKLTDPISTFLFYGHMIQAYDEIYDLNLLAEMNEGKDLNVVDPDSFMSFFFPVSTSSAISFFNKEFLDKFNKGQLPALSQKLLENSVHDWIPTAPTRFYQGRADDIVAFEPVVELVQEMKDKGAKDVELVECSAFWYPSTPTNCSIPSMIYALEFFNQYAQDL